MSAVEFSEIANRWGFDPPVCYVQALRSGWLEALSSDPGGGLWCEWLSLHEIANYEGPTGMLGCLVPFAHNGGGELWCWRTDWKTDDERTPIVYCTKSYEGHVMAHDFSRMAFPRVLARAGVSAARKRS